jgi:hypothetical protein
MADEAVPADPAPADVHSAVHSEPDAGGVFPWLPGEEEFERLMDGPGYDALLKTL